MEQKIIRDIRLLKWYAGCLTIVVLLLSFTSFRQEKKQMDFEELNVGRINILEKDGTLKMVISNKVRQHPGMSNGKTFPARKREAGIIFFNSAGDECGGLAYDGVTGAADFALSIDQLRNDQIMQLQYGQSGTGDSVRRHYGLKLWDRSDAFTLAQQITLIDSLKQLKQQEELSRQLSALRAKGLLGVERMFAGKNTDGEVGLFIRDDKGRVRIKIFCDNQNNPKMLVLDERGREQTY